MLGISAGGWNPYSSAAMYMKYAAYSRPVASSAGVTPVPPVTKADPVERGQGSRGVLRVPEQGEESMSTGIPFLREGVDPVEMAVRGRIEYIGGEEPADEAEKSAGDAVKGEKDISGEEKKSAQEEMEDAECQTCKKRKYQDGSDDPGVSFKSPTNVAPEAAASAVRGHEMEHVVREQAKAQQEGRKVVSQSVTLHTAICPECGDIYISGGTTRTTTVNKEPVETPAENESDKESEDAATPLAS